MILLLFKKNDFWKNNDVKKQLNAIKKEKITIFVGQTPKYRVSLPLHCHASAGECKYYSVVDIIKKGPLS